jgi:hypothetical protein
MFFINKPKLNESPLEKALRLGLITKEEYLKLMCDRADTKLKDYYFRTKKRKK